MTLLVRGMVWAERQAIGGDACLPALAACPAAMLPICWWGRHSCLPRAGAERRTRSSSGARRPVTTLDVSRRPKCRAFGLRGPAAALQRKVRRGRSPARPCEPGSAIARRWRFTGPYRTLKPEKPAGAVLVVPFLDSRLRGNDVIGVGNSKRPGTHGRIRGPGGQAIGV